VKVIIDTCARAESPRRGKVRGMAAFTRKDLVVVVLLVFGLVLFPIQMARRSNEKSKRLACVNNLKQIGVGYRIWANDHGSGFPDFTPQTKGSADGILYFTNATIRAWTIYPTIASVLGRSPEILVCPTDERKPAISGSAVANTNVSYFMCAAADDSYPQSLLCGDRNVGPGTVPDPDYGFSPTSGKGNDVLIKGPVCWSLKMHSGGTPQGAGDILLGDGSVQQASSSNLYGYWIKNALAEKPAHNPATNLAGVRAIFP
jgi:hypothetical protein